MKGLFLDDMLVYLEAQEAGIVQLRQQIKKLLGETKPSTKLPFDMSGIKWTEAEGSRGTYERSEDVNSLDFKKLVKFLADGGGFISIREEGRLWNVWLFRNGNVVGRKLKNPNSKSIASDR